MLNRCFSCLLFFDQELKLVQLCELKAFDKKTEFICILIIIRRIVSEFFLELRMFRFNSTEIHIAAFIKRFMAFKTISNFEFFKSTIAEFQINSMIFKNCWLELEVQSYWQLSDNKLFQISTCYLHSLSNIPTRTQPHQGLKLAWRLDKVTNPKLRKRTCSILLVVELIRWLISQMWYRKL